MKKYTLFLIVFALFSFGLSVNLATAASCAQGELFDTSTGKPCNTSALVECPTGYKFNTFTGKPCTKWTSTTKATTTSSDLKIGSRGEAVKLFQQTLKDKGFLTGKVDGVYGPMTDKAAKEYYKKYPPVSSILPPPCPLVTNSDGTTTHECPESTITISGISGPQSLKANEKGTWTVKASSTTGGNLSYYVNWGDEATLSTQGINESMRPIRPPQQSATFSHAYAKRGVYKPTFTVVSSNTINCITTPCPSNEDKAQASLTVDVGGVISNNSIITVTSPNGGESWPKGTKQKIQWVTTSPVFNCVTAPCEENRPAPKYFDIVLQPTCASEICTAIYRAPYQIAKNVSGESYEWSVGTVLAPIYASSETIQNTTVPDGAYLIKVCEAGKNLCDSSNSYLKITTGSVVTPSGTLYIEPSSAMLKVGDTTTLQAMYQPPMPPCPEGLACRMVMPSPYPVVAKWTSTDTKVATVAYKNNCAPGALCGLADMTDYKTATITGVSKGETIVSASYKNETGAIASASMTASAKITVDSPTTTSAPRISSMYPTSGVVGSTVSISGTGFTRAGNKIKFGNLNTEDNPAYNLSSNGRSLTFTVPYSNYFSCWDAYPYPCNLPATATALGKYEVSVINANGTSNTFTFRVTGAPVAMCDYAAPPQGCTYVQGENYDPATQCGLVLKCSGNSDEKVLGAESFKFTLALKKGSTGNEVMELQKFLSKAGHYADLVDGNFGPNTHSALVKFQIANGLTADGIVGPLVRAILNR